MYNMDWNLKTPSRDLAEFEEEAGPNISPVSGSSGFGGQGRKGDFSVDLKLGHMVNLGNESAENSQVPSVPKMGLLPPGSSKRARAANNGIHAASCMVDGCGADLRNCKEYHKRHKVCEKHSKSPEVTIGGLKQRFCQQCSRFHSLEEFDEGKRSCRKRLDGHNRRRRKPQPEPLSRTGSFLSSYQGTRLFPFTGPEVYPNTALPNPIWAGVVKTRQDAPELYNQHVHVHLHDRHNLYPGSSSSRYRDEGKQFSFLQGNTLALSCSSSQMTVPDTSACQPFLKTSESGGHSHEMLSDGLSTQVLNSNRALSLLSSSPMQTSDMGFSPVVAPVSIPLTHPFGSSLHDTSLDGMDPILVPNASDADLHCQGMFLMGCDSSSKTDTSQTFPFCWE